MPTGIRDVAMAGMLLGGVAALLLCVGEVVVMTVDAAARAAGRLVNWVLGDPLDREE